MKSISLKVGLIYVLFSIFTIALFTVSIYIEQIGLIVKNRELEALLQTEKVYLPLKYSLLDSPESQIQHLSRDRLVAKLNLILSDITEEEYLIFTEKGEILYTSSEGLDLDEKNRTDAISAIANNEFMNQPYLLQTNETDETDLYIPVVTGQTDAIIILFKYNIENIETHLFSLYTVVTFVVCIVLFTQIVFAIIFYFMVIWPVKQINKTSLKIKTGHLTSRVMIKKKDELGQLGDSFNAMADSIEKKIKQLKKKNDIMEFELKTAGKVQSGIYPQIRSSELFDVAIHHKPLGIVSGDYHDIFKVNDHKYGFLIADVSGHGVPAALITMRIQNTFKRLVSRYEDPSKLFSNINNELVDLMERFSCYFTAFYFSLDKNMKIVYTNGGHPAVYLLKSRQKKIYELTTDGFFLGLTKEVSEKFQSRTRDIEPGDKIILFSDGILEARNNKNEQYETERLLQSIKKHAHQNCNAMKELIIKDLDAFTGKVKRKDDETLMIIEIKKVVGSKKNTSPGEKRIGFLKQAIRLQ